RVATGLARFDGLLGGGLPRGVVTQVVAPAVSSGATLLLSEVADALQRKSQRVAWIDGTDNFEPGVLTTHLLWVRCRWVPEALTATDLLLRDGNVPFVILDLKQSRNFELRRVSGQTWYRLQRLAEETQTSLVLLTRYPLAACASVTLRLSFTLGINDLLVASPELLAAAPFEVHWRKAFSEQAYAEA
ncbi:MAG TPA: hypothetical protein VGD78_06130, partial [Chthoniobacterales bacterium]